MIGLRTDSNFRPADLHSFFRTFVLSYWPALNVLVCLLTFLYIAWPLYSSGDFNASTGTVLSSAEYRCKSPTSYLRGPLFSSAHFLAQPPTRFFSIDSSAPVIADHPKCTGTWYFPSIPSIFYRWLLRTRRTFPYRRSRWDKMLIPMRRRPRSGSVNEEFWSQFKKCLKAVLHTWIFRTMRRIQ